MPDVYCQIRIFARADIRPKPFLTVGTGNDTIVKISLSLQEAGRKEFLMEIKKIVAFFQKSNKELKRMTDELSVQEMKYLRNRLSDFSGLLYEAEQKQLKAKEEEQQGQRGKTLPCCFLK